MREVYDYAVIGSGPAGHVSAMAAARLGLKTVIVEKNSDMTGGVCLNEGCIPAKSLFDSAHFFDFVKNHPSLFPGAASSVTGIFPEIMARSAAASDKLKRGLTAHLKKLGIEMIYGAASFENKSSLKIVPVEGEPFLISFKKALIASGSSPKGISDMPFMEGKIISSSEAVRMNKVPGNMLIVGGGAIGVEFASFFSTMGARVSLVEAQAEILPREDRDVSSAIRGFLRRKGVEVSTSASAKYLSIEEGKVRTRIVSGGEEKDELYDTVLVAVGRVPATGELALENAGITVDPRGFIPVEPSFETASAGIFAAGDVIDSPMLAHAAQAEGEAAAFSARGRQTKAIDYSSMPNAVYSAVQAASVGFTEQEARKRGPEVVVGKSFFKANGKAVLSGGEEGFVKIVAEAESKVVLGAHVVGSIATEIIPELTIAKRLGLTVSDIAWTIHAHPTFSESVQSAAKEIIFSTI